MEQQIPVLIVTGPVGVGKSTVADSVFETLKDRGLPIALINLDELGYANVQPEDPLKVKLRFKNLRSVWKNYSEAGVKYAVIPWVIEAKEDLNNFYNAIPGARISVTLLTASMDVLRQRLSSRPMGGELDWHIKRAKELIKIYESNKFSDTIINTDNLTITEVALSLIREWPKD